MIATRPNLHAVAIRFDDATFACFTWSCRWLALTVDSKVGPVKHRVLGIGYKPDDVWTVLGGVYWSLHGVTSAWYWADVVKLLGVRIVFARAVARIALDESRAIVGKPSC